MPHVGRPPLELEDGGAKRTLHSIGEACPLADTIRGAGVFECSIPPAPRFRIRRVKWITYKLYRHWR